MDAIVTALPLALDPQTLLLTLVGSFLGIVFGSIPGLTYSMALALVLPMTFALSPMPAMALLLGTYIGGMTGGSISAILLGIPGTPSAAATMLDGYPLAKSGKAGLALGTAVLVSAFGGLFSLAVMMASVQLIAQLAIKFGPVEIFALVLFGLSTICGLAERSLVRGMIAGVLGMLLMTVGLDELSGVPRMTFGTTALLQGVDLVVAMVGIFAVPQVIQALVDYRTGREIVLHADAVRSELPGWRQLKRNAWLMTRCAGIGTGIGAIPGAGGPIAAFLAYDHARRFSRRKASFGRGELSGVVAPETANNAVTGGTMIPLLSLGIPGDPATAIILGGLLIHGLVPGPMLFVQHPAEVYTLYMIIAAAYVGVVAIQYFGIRAFVQVLRVPPHILAVAILIMCAVGTFAIRHSFLDVYIMTLIGLIGYVLIRVRIPVTPVILGLVLGATLEENFRTAMIVSGGDFAAFYTSPVALGFFFLIAVVLVVQLRSSLRMARPGMPAEPETQSREHA